MANKKLITLSQTDRDVLVKVVEDYLHRRQNDYTRTSIHRDQSQTPEVYIGLTPHGGIAALNEAPGSSGSAGTGDEPGAGECEIYRIDESVDPPLMEYAGFTRDVYNLSGTAITGMEWVLLVKEKFGSWIITDVIGAASGETTFTIKETDGSPITTSTALFPSGSLTDNGDGTVDVNVASPSLVGFVTAPADATTVQEFSGIKSIWSGGGAWQTTFGANPNDVMQLRDIGAIDSTVSLGGNFAGLRGTLNSGFDHIYAGLTSAYSFVIAFDSNNTSLPGKYSIVDSGVLYDGATGTGGSGDSFVGGLFVSAGSGANLDMGEW